MPAGCVALQTRLLAGFYCDVIQMSKATHLAFLLLSCCALFLLFSAGLELMDTMGSLQEAAYERLCRWGTRGAAAGSCRGPCSPAPPACMPREAHVRPARQLVGWLPFLLRPCCCRCLLPAGGCSRSAGLSARWTLQRSTRCCRRRRPRCESAR